MFILICDNFKHQATQFLSRHLITLFIVLSLSQISDINYSIIWEFMIHYKGNAMQTISRVGCTLSMIFILTGCSTTAHFKTPENATLYLQNTPLPAEISAEGVVTRRPFFWNAASGIKYVLKRDGTVIQEGKLPSKFRVVSIFWPPYALLYWPIGFALDTYDLTNDSFTSQKK